MPEDMRAGSEGFERVNGARFYPTIEQQHKQEQDDEARKGARATDPLTSKIAAAMREAPRSNHRVKLLEVFSQSATPLSDREAFRFTDLPEHSCWWKRCSELRQAGLIKAVGIKICTETKTPVRLCRVTDHGRILLGQREAAERIKRRPSNA